MSDTIANRLPSQYWYFTFGASQPHANCFIVFHGTYEEARQQMVNSFGQKWSMQYSAKQFEGQAERYNLKQIF